MNEPPARTRDEAEAPEHHNERRRFLIWSLMLGVVKPERVTERVVAEINGELEEAAHGS